MSMIFDEAKQAAVFAALDAACVPLPIGPINFDVLAELADQRLPPTADDDDIDGRWSTVWKWAKARGVRITV